MTFGEMALVSFLISGAVGLIVWLAMRARAVAEFQRGVDVSSAQLSLEKSARAVAEERASRVTVLEDQVRLRESDVGALRERNAQLSAELDAERRQSTEKLNLLIQARETLSEQFQNLANKIFDEKGAKFLLQNKESLELTIGPLREGLKEFKTKVEDVYEKESKQRFSLQNEIAKLVELNNRIGQDAINLTNALKGHGKTQGDWGELVLERVLESSGLQKGREYEVQASYDKDDGKRARPDVVIKLPENKNIVVDSKVSLTAYEEYSSAETDDERAGALRRHIESIRSHLEGLSAQNYQALYGIRSPDFVLMFMPIEPAFMLAVQSDQKLFADAFRKNIMIVGPWNLLISLKTIASIWRYEYQNRNALELARQCTALYDKFVGFVKDVEDIGAKINSAHGSYEAALGKLSSGKGNLVRQVERIRKLGLKPTKLLPQTLVEESAEGLADQEDDQTSLPGSG